MLLPAWREAKKSLPRSHSPGFPSTFAVPYVTSGAAAATEPGRARAASRPASAMVDASRRRVERDTIGSPKIRQRSSARRARPDRHRWCSSSTPSVRVRLGPWSRSGCFSVLGSTVSVFEARTRQHREGGIAGVARVGRRALAQPEGGAATRHDDPRGTAGAAQAGRWAGHRRLRMGRMAERVGFEPTKSFDSALFKSAAINRSATSPRARIPASDAGSVDRAAASNGLGPKTEPADLAPHER